MAGMRVLHRTRGFTMVELLVVLVIIAILTAFVGPSFQQALLSNRLASYANSWVSAAQVARSEAFKRNATVTLCRSADQATCAASGTWQQGWVVLANDGTVISAQGSISSAYKFTACSDTTHGSSCDGSGSYSVTFQPTGINSGANRLWLCRSSPSVGNQEREIYLQVSGKPLVTTYRTSTCS